MEIKQILRLHYSGLSNRKIAKQLSISRNTVNQYVALFKTRQEPLAELIEWTEEQISTLFAETEYERQDDRYKDLVAYFSEVKRRRGATGFTLEEDVGAVSC